MILGTTGASWFCVQSPPQLCPSPTPCRGSEQEGPTQRYACSQPE